MSAVGRLIEAHLSAHPDRTAKAVADLAGVSPQLLSGWMNGQQVKEYPKPETMVRLAAALGMTYQQVLIAFTTDLGHVWTTQEVDPDLTIGIASLSRLSPERLRTATRMLADLAGEQD